MPDEEQLDEYTGFKINSAVVLIVIAAIYTIAGSVESYAHGGFVYRWANAVLGMG